MIDTSPLAIRTLLDQPEPLRRIGPYRLVQKLGNGAFAPVWLADEVFGETKLRTAAVKVFALESDDGQTTLTGDTGRAQRRARILEEAQALCRVQHPNIVQFYALAVDEERGLIGLAMEYVAGTPLRTRLERAGKLPFSETLSIGIGLASALSAVHRVGLVHRDVKPDNVIDSGGAYRLIDFGIAAAHQRSTAAKAKPSKQVLLDDLPLELVGSKLAALPGAMTIRQDDATEITSGLQVSGTMGYIDPACVRGEAATPASDLYSLGALLFECMTGMLPAVAAAGASGGLRGDVLDGRARPPGLASIAEDVPPAFASLVDELLDPERSKRPRAADLAAVELVRIQAEISGRKRALPPEETGPFRGLGRFESPDRDVFFGRSAEVAGAIEMLRTRGVVTLVGPSGCGKSSLARAGVLPAIAEGALGGSLKAWDTAVAAPGADPRAAIGAALSPIVPGAAERAPLEVVIALAERAQAVERGVVLLVDQLEELVTVAAEGPSRAWAAAVLERIGEQPIPGVRAVLTARRDLIGDLYGALDSARILARGTLLVSAVTDAVWGVVLDASLDAYGYSFEDASLRNEVLAALRDAETAMPLVQFALTKLWERRDQEKKLITRAGLAAIGGIDGALEQHADATVRALATTDPAAREVVRELLLALTTPQGTRAARPREDLMRLGHNADACRRALSALEEARLIVRDSVGLTLAHETLLVRWATLRSWLAEAREDRLLAEEIELSAKKWDEQKRDETLLWKKRRLVAAEDLRRRSSTHLSAAASAFIETGRRAERRTIAIAIAIGCGAIIAACTFFLMYVTRINAETKEKDDALTALAKANELAKHKANEADENAKVARKAESEAESEKKKRVAELEDLLQRLASARGAEREKLEEEVRQRRNQAAAELSARAAASAAAAAASAAAIATGTSTVVGDPP